MLANIFNKGSCPIGIDIGNDSVKLLQIERRGSGRTADLRATAAAIQPLPRDLTLGDARYHGEVGDAIRKGLERGSFTGKSVVSSLPAGAVEFKSLRLPKMPQGELGAAAAWEARERMQMGDDPMTVQHLPAGEVRQGDELRQEVILLAARTGFIEQHTQELVNRNLKPLAIEVGAVAVARLFSGRGDEGEGADVLVDIGYAGTDVIIVKEGRTLFLKQIDIGLRTLDEAVAKRLNVPLHEAEKLRRSVEAEAAAPVDTASGDAPGTDDRADRSVGSAIQSSVEELGREIGLCLRYYSVTFRGKRPERVTVVGGGSADARLIAMLPESTGADVVTVDPLGHLDLTAVRGVIDEGLGTGSFAVAAGLSLRTDKQQARKGAA